MSHVPTYGLTEQGFNIKRMPEIISDIEDDEKIKFGNDINLKSDSVFSQLNGVFSKPAIDIWEILEDIYQQQHPSEAGNIHLDYLCELNAIVRLAAISSQVNIALRGDLNTLIPQDTQIIDTNGNIYYAYSNYTLSNVDQLKMYITVATVENETEYTIQFDEVTYSFTSSISTSESEIINGLIDEINNDISKFIDVTNLDDKIIKCVGSTGGVFYTNVSENLYFWMPAKFLSIIKDSIYSPLYSITEVITPVSGLEEINNFEEGILGRTTESDTDLRLRRKNSLQNVGGGNLNAIVSRVQNDVVGVTSVKGYENRESSVVDGLPPHSISIFIEGGDPIDICNKLWEVKGGGIQTYGKTYFDIIDSNGDKERIFFSRPVPFYVWVKVEYTKYNEEIFPVNGEDTMKDIVLEYGNIFTVGLDIIPQRFTAPLFTGVVGIETIIVKIFASLNSGDTPSYVTTPLSVSYDRIATFDLSRIIIEEV
jgi:uncharacterized phage protein gp47/JayE